MPNPKILKSKVFQKDKGDDKLEIVKRDDGYTVLQFTENNYSKSTISCRKIDTMAWFKTW